MQLYCKLFASYISARSGAAAVAEKGTEKEGRAAEEVGLDKMRKMCPTIAGTGHESANRQGGEVTVAEAEAKYCVLDTVLDTPCCVIMRHTMLRSIALHYTWCSSTFYMTSKAASMN